MQKATLAGGCFWCTQAVFKRLKGVKEIISGYSGGSKENPGEMEVYSGITGHAEAIQITFDPQVISYETLLEVFFHMHDPTTANRQGADIGDQYRSAIFYHDKEQRSKALYVKKQIEESGEYKNPIVTEIVPFNNFYKASGYHQDYYDQNRSQPYCILVIDPKIEKLTEKYGSFIENQNFQ